MHDRKPYSIFWPKHILSDSRTIIWVGSGIMIVHDSGAKSSRGFVAKRVFTSYSYFQLCDGWLITPWCALFIPICWWPFPSRMFSIESVGYNQSTSQILRVLCARRGARSFARTEGQDSEFLAATMQGREMKDDMTGASQSRLCRLHSAMCWSTRS